MLEKIGSFFREEEAEEGRETRRRSSSWFTFDLIINTTLMVLMGIVVAVGVISLIYELFVQVFSISFLEEIEKMPDVLSLFLWVLIAIELLDSVRTYYREHHFHVETVVSVAVIAAARKVIVLDLHTYEPLMIISLSAVIIAICGGYYLVRKSHAYTTDAAQKEKH